MKINTANVAEKFKRLDNLHPSPLQMETLAEKIF